MKRLRVRPSTLVIVGIFLATLALYILFRPAPSGIGSGGGSPPTTAVTQVPEAPEDHLDHHPPSEHLAHERRKQHDDEYFTHSGFCTCDLDV